jgi:hypothetical protein
MYSIVSLTTDEVEGKGAQMAKEEIFFSSLLLSPKEFPMRSPSNKR